MVDVSQPGTVDDAGCARSNRHCQVKHAYNRQHGSHVVCMCTCHRQLAQAFLLRNAVGVSTDLFLLCSPSCRSVIIPETTSVTGAPVGEVDVTCNFNDVHNSRVEVRPDRNYLKQQLKAVEARVMAIQEKKRKLDQRMSSLTDGLKVSVWVWVELRSWQLLLWSSPHLPAYLHETDKAGQQCVRCVGM